MIEVLKQAIDYIENVPDDRDSVGHINKDALVLSLNQSIKEWESAKPYALDKETGILLYTHPPQRTEPVDYEKLAALGWQAIECRICGGGAMGYPQCTFVGLTDDEREQIINANTATGLWHMAKDIEAKLKEKNT